MRAMAPDGLSDLLACVAAFGSSLGQSFDPTGVLAEFSARTQPVVPHDYMLIAVREDDGHTYSVFAEYAVRGSVGCDNKRYTTAFERGGRAAMDSFALAPVFGGEAERVADMASDDRLGEASACRATLDELGLRSRLAVPLCAGGHVRGALIVMSATVGLYTEAHALACRQVSDLIGPFVHTAVALHRERRRRERLAAATALAPILGASLKVGDVLERLGEAMRPLIDFDTMGLALRAADGPGFERSEIIGVRRPGYATTPAVEDYSTLERVSRGEIILVRDARRERRRGRHCDRRRARAGGPASAAGRTPATAWRGGGEGAEAPATGGVAANRSRRPIRVRRDHRSGTEFHRGSRRRTQGGPHRYDGAAHRRERDRQGGPGPGDPSRESASRGTIRRPQLRGVAGNFDRVRAVRPRARGLHRRR